MFKQNTKVSFFSALLIILPVVLLFFTCDNDSTKKKTYTVNVVNATITVYANSYNSYQVNVTTSMENARLSGSFTASGGSGNDIKVYVMDNTNYINWTNGHQVSTYYSSGQVTTGSFNVSISTTGTYYLVYSNTFSVITDKQVVTNVNLKYEAY